MTFLVIEMSKINIQKIVKIKTYDFNCMDTAKCLTKKHVICASNETAKCTVFMVCASFTNFIYQAIISSAFLTGSL